MVNWLYRNRIFNVKDETQNRAIIVSEVPRLRKADLTWIKDGKYFSQYVIILSSPYLNIMLVNQCKSLDEINPEEYYLSIEIEVGRETDRLWRKINDEIDLYVINGDDFNSILTRLSNIFA